MEITRSTHPLLVRKMPFLVKLVKCDIFVPLLQMNAQLFVTSNKFALSEI